MPDRSVSPPIVTDYSLKFPPVEAQSLSNGMQLHFVRGQASGIVRVDLLWKGGRVIESKKGLARSAVKSMADGFEGCSAFELAELFDYYGASVGHSSRMEGIRSSLSVLTKHFEDVFGSYLNTIFKTKVSSDELANRQQIFKQKLENELSKNNVISYREFTSKIFGEDHVYGYNTAPSDYIAISTDDVENYLKSYISTEGCNVIVSGDISAELESTIVSYLEQIDKRTSKFIASEEVVTPASSGEFLLPGSQPNQVSIRLGKVLFDRYHPDYYLARMVNVLIGGYFGSRLMMNIREDKGYCYHIDSVIDCMNYGGYFSIGADVKADKYLECIEEIKKELNDLCTVLISEEELSKLRQYIKGQILMSIDGVFAASSLLRKYLENNQEIGEFYTQLDVINTTTPQDILDLCQKYFSPEDFVILCVGASQN